MPIFSDVKSRYPPGRLKRESAYNSVQFCTLCNSALMCSSVVFHHKNTSKITNKNNLFSRCRLVKSQHEPVTGEARSVRSYGRWKEVKTVYPWLISLEAYLPSHHISERGPFSGGRSILYFPFPIYHSFIQKLLLATSASNLLSNFELRVLLSNTIGCPFPLTASGKSDYPVPITFFPEMKTWKTFGI